MLVNGVQNNNSKLMLSPILYDMVRQRGISEDDLFMCLLAPCFVNMNVKLFFLQDTVQLCGLLALILALLSVSLAAKN